jgi:hypothetical protein
VYLPGFEEHGGYCAAQCEGVDDTCPWQPYPAAGECALSDMDESFWCILFCEETGDCPPTQVCVEAWSDVMVCL